MTGNFKGNMESNILLERLDLIKRYLRVNGWTRLASNNSKLLLYQGPVDDLGRPIKIGLPFAAEFEDTKQLIHQAIELIATLQKRTFSEISEEIAHFGCDFFRQRIITPTNSSTLSLSEINRLIESLTSLIKYSARMEEDAQPFFAKSTGSGRVIADKCRFGQTFVGSFGLSIEMPVPPSLKEDDKQIPFERRVMERVARGFSVIRRALQEADAKLLIDNYKQGFNANQYESLKKCFEATPDYQMEFSFSWSNEYQISSDLRQLSPIKFFSSELVPFLETAAKSLRKLSESESVTVTGKIIQLQARGPLDEEDIDDANVSDADSPQIVIDWQIKKNKHAAIRVALSPDEYRQACDAHRDEKTVSIHGMPEKARKFLYLTSPKDFRILES